jgi:hypothetical protein
MAQIPATPTVGMSPASAEGWVTTSALIVLAVYGYRRLTETATAKVSLKSVAGVGALPPLGQFVTAWGLTYIIVSVIAQSSPGGGGGFAILIMTVDLLTNAQSVFGDALTAEGSAAGVKNAAATSLAHPTSTVSPAGTVDPGYPHPQPLTAPTGVTGTDGYTPLATPTG